MSPRASLLGAAAVGLLAVGCGRTPPDFPIDTGASASASSGELPPLDSGSTGELNCIDHPDACVAELSLRRAVDILFVVDNSGSMGGEQGTLARSFGSFIEVLEAQEVGANYRVGVTTTDSDGRVFGTSCRSRLQDFVSSSPIYGDKDERQRGCLDHCELETVNISEPWVEKSNGTTNLPPGVGLAQALQCIGPQGISGSGFEMPLETMRSVLLNDPSGFLRTDAILAVIFVTDEADCSMSFDQIDWLASQGQAFWTDPERLSSGACWTAGVQCLGGPGVYDDCVAVPKGRDGNPTDDPDASLLYPVSRYIDTLAQVAAAKQAAGGQSEVLIALLGGVPLDHPETGNLLYADSPDTQFNVEYGIGPGCGLGTETVDDPPGIPPVRLRDFAQAFASDSRNMFSVCADDYAIALQDIASSIGEISERACVAGCVRDLRYDIPGLQPDCRLDEVFAGPEPDRPVERCMITEFGWAFPDDETHVCFRPLTDIEGVTPGTVDDMSPQCVTLEANLELVIERRDGVPVASGTAVKVQCDLEAPVGTTCDEV